MQTTSTETKVLGILLDAVYDSFDFLKDLGDQDKVSIPTRVSADFRNRYRNLSENLRDGNITLMDANKHILFYNSEQAVHLLINTKTNQGSELFDVLKSNFGKFVVFRYNWKKRLSKIVAQYIEIEAVENKKAKDDLSAMKQAVGDNSPGLSTASGTTLGLRNSFYNVSYFTDLIRFIRNLYTHWEDGTMDEALKNELGERPEQFLRYFTSRYPALLTFVFVCASNTKVFNVVQCEKIAHNQSYITIGEVGPTQNNNESEDWEV